MTANSSWLRWSFSRRLGRIFALFLQAIGAATCLIMLFHAVAIAINQVMR
jgi:hypothetical protein